MVTPYWTSLIIWMRTCCGFASSPCIWYILNMAPCHSCAPFQVCSLFDVSGCLFVKWPLTRDFDSVDPWPETVLSWARVILSLAYYSQLFFLTVDWGPSRLLLVVTAACWTKPVHQSLPPIKYFNKVLEICPPLLNHCCQLLHSCHKTKLLPFKNHLCDFVLDPQI